MTTLTRIDILFIYLLIDTFYLLIHEYKNTATEQRSQQWKSK